ncbi:MAG: isocitrate/isopropylmalate family dehydrogenase, partial [Pseudomonadota bacterium]
MSQHVVVLPGDGIGPEVSAAAIAVIHAVNQQFGRDIRVDSDRIGGDAIDHEGTPLSEETLSKCQQADAVLLGAVGGPKWQDPDIRNRPEAGLLGLRAGMQLFGNLRPVVTQPATYDASPLKPERLVGVDILV